MIQPVKIPKRLAIIQAMQDHLAAISRADGYNFDLLGKVFRNRILLGTEVTAEAPCVSIVEAPRADIALYAGNDESYSKSRITILIQGIVKDDKTDNTVDDAYYLCNDVEVRLARLIAIKPSSGRPMYPDEYMLGGIITSVEIAPAVVRPPEAQVSTSAFFYMALRLGVAGEIGT